VDDELARLEERAIPGANAATPGANGHVARNGHLPRGRVLPVRSDGEGRPRPRPATEGQIKAIYAIARNQRVDLESLLREEYTLKRPEELSLSQASRLIDLLKTDVSG
jgi:hypothetical protein